MARSDWFDEAKAALGGEAHSLIGQMATALDRLHDAQREHGQLHEAAGEAAEVQAPESAAKPAAVAWAAPSVSGTGTVGSADQPDA